ncbi:MAG: DUF3179 domain-containing protein [bacterium]|nr:DUF3179 domain-containing protein [bacterium]
MNTKIIISLIAGLILIVLIVVLTRQSNEQAGKQENNLTVVNPGDTTREAAFQAGGLKTNTAITSIALENVLDGGPGKDGIPAITDPKFIKVTEAKKWLKDDADGIVVTIGKTIRFYPYNIIVWHEIVNDVIEKKPLVVTFCPLCGSAIVFDASMNGKSEQFGVSGKLFESNLLMYDKTTESLWSQIIGEAVVGDRTGEKLSVYPSQVMSFKQASGKYPSMDVLSKETGYSRSYDVSPYGDYDTNDKIYFPISINDTRLLAKEIMYIVNIDDESVAFKRSALSESEKAVVSVGNKKITAQIINGEIEVKNDEGKIIPGYTAMWFSWAIHHQKNGVVWQGSL